MKTVQLRYVADVRTSSVDKLTVDGEIPVRLCNYVDVYRNDSVRPGPGLMTASATTDEVNRFRLAVGDTVLTKDSEDPADIGISAFIPETAADFVCGYHLAIARPLAGTHPRFLTWALRSRPVLAHFTSNASGISRYGLTSTGLLATPVPWPTPTEQRRIADFLDDRVARIDQIIDARQRQRTLVAAQANAIADDLMREGGESLSRLGHFITRIEQGWSPQCDNQPAGPGEWGVTKVGAVQQGWFDESQNKHLPYAEQAKPEYEVRAGDLLVSRANTPERVGFFAVVPSSVRHRLILCDKIMRVRLDGQLAPDFVALVGQARRTRDRFTLAGTGTSDSMVNIRGEDIRDLKVPLLPMDQQTSWVTRWQDHQAASRVAAATLLGSVPLLAEYKQSLITAAVTGELDVTMATTRIPGE